MAAADSFKVLFVCLGNICRSPAAEGVMRKVVERAGLAGHVAVSSAGTAGYHDGDLPDARMREAAARRGCPLTSRARRVARADLDSYDLVLAMDEANLRDLLALADTPARRARVKLFGDYCRHRPGVAVPDPYYGGPEGFEEVLDLLEDGCEGLLSHLRERLGRG